MPGSSSKARIKGFRFTHLADAPLAPDDLPSRESKEKNMIQATSDYQLHTRYSGRAEDRMTHQAIAAYAPGAGLRAVGFTDHIYRHTTIADLEQLEHGVRAARQETPAVRVYFGIETEMADPQRTTVPRGWRDRFNYVLLALDHAKACDYKVPQREDVAGWLDHYERGYRLAASGQVDVMAHPFSGCPAALAAIDANRLDRMLAWLAEGKVALELNGIRLHRVTEREPFLNLYRRARGHGLKFSTGSDAHCWNELPAIHWVDPWLAELEIEEHELWHPAMRH